MSVTAIVVQGVYDVYHRVCMTYLQRAHTCTRCLYAEMSINSTAPHILCMSAILSLCAIGCAWRAMHMHAHAYTLHCTLQYSTSWSLSRSNSRYETNLLPHSVLLCLRCCCARCARWCPGTPEQWHCKCSCPDQAGA